MKRSNSFSLGLLLLLGSVATAGAQTATPPTIVINPQPAAAGAAPAAGGEKAMPTAGPTTYTEVPGADFSKLNDAQKKMALAIMNEERCNCGCGFTVAGCRHKDSTCPVSPGLAAGVVADILLGKSEADIRKGLAPKPTPVPPPPPPPLDTKVNTIDYTNLPSKGPKNAKIVMAEVSDFQCPFCALAQPWVHDVMAAYPNDLRVVFKQFPLVTIHPNAHYAAEASLAANAQGKFWEMHDKLFKITESRQPLSPENVKNAAKEIGLDLAKFDKEMTDGTYKAKVDKDMKEGTDLGVNGTPTFFLNGRKYNGGRDVASVKKAVDEMSKGGAPAAEAKPAAAEPAKKDAAKKDAKKEPAKKSNSDQ